MSMLVVLILLVASVTHMILDTEAMAPVVGVCDITKLIMYRHSAAMSKTSNSNKIGPTGDVEECDVLLYILMGVPLEPKLSCQC